MLTRYLFIIFSTLLCCYNCSSTSDTVIADDDVEEIILPSLGFASIDFSNWKVTIPVDLNNDGKPDEFAPSRLINYGYQNIKELKPYVYDDTTDKSIVFYAFPEVSTANSSYSRSELRELINPQNSRENWSLEEGGKMTGKLKIEKVSNSTDEKYQYHRVIFMQIHGIISPEDMARHNFSSNNGPPLLKMYWIDGYLWAHKKSLVKNSTEGDALLDVSSKTWTDIKHNFGYVGFEPFEFSITASKGKLELQLNSESSYIFEDVSLEKWPFENYFKAGNYLITTEKDAFAYVKFFDLNLIH